MLNSKLISENKLYILAVSGGPDSMFLVDKMRSEYNLVVAHVNYQKRSTSVEDEKIVRNYCQKYSLLCEIYQVKSSEYNLIGNFQDKARQIRYDFFQKLAEKYRTKYIVVAHHFDDHLETYLLQKQRKSLVEYWGLPAKTRQEKYWIIRPLLSINKQQIYKYLDQKKIKYAVDITNQLPIYQRNIIRQKLNNLSKKEKKSLTQEITQKNQELKKVKKLVKIATQKLIISLSILKIEKEIYPAEVYLRLLYFWINQATGGILQKRKKKLLIEVYNQLFKSREKNLSINLGNNFYLVKSQGRVLILPKIY